VLKLGNITDAVGGDANNFHAKEAPVSTALPKKDAKKSAPALGKSAKVQVAVADLQATSEHVDEPRDMKDDDGSGEMPKSMD
jgi:hypothetical protein